MRLFGSSISPFVRKVMWLLGELDLSSEQIEIAPHSDQPDFRRASPMGRIPGFTDGGFAIADSAAICRYLVMREHSDLLGGPSPQRQARIVQWETFGDDDLAGALRAPLIQRVVNPARHGRAADESLLQTALTETLPALYGHLDRSLAERGPWLTGETFSHADIAIGAHMTTALLVDALPERGQHSALWDWLTAIGDRPAYRAMLDRTRTAVARLQERR